MKKQNTSKKTIQMHTFSGFPLNMIIELEDGKKYKVLENNSVVIVTLEQVDEN